MIALRSPALAALRRRGSRRPRSRSSSRRRRSLRRRRPSRRVRAAADRDRGSSASSTCASTACRRRSPRSSRAASRSSSTASTYWLAPRSRMHEMMANSTKWTEGCVVGSCLAEVKTPDRRRPRAARRAHRLGHELWLRRHARAHRHRPRARAGVRALRRLHGQRGARPARRSPTVQLLTAVPDKLPDEAADAQAALAHDPGQADTQAAARQAPSQELATLRHPRRHRGRGRRRGALLPARPCRLRPRDRGRRRWASRSAA